MASDGARPGINAKHVGPAAVPQIRPAGHVGYGQENNNQDSAKRPAPIGSAPDSHVNTPEGRPYDVDEGGYDK